MKCTTIICFVISTFTCSSLTSQVLYDTIIGDCRFYFNVDTDTFKILYKGTEFYATHKMSHFYYDENEESSFGLRPRMKDLDCDGDKELILKPFTRGAHCCFGLKIWEFNEEPILVFEAPEKDSGGYHLSDINDDCTLDLSFNDDSWLYWNTDYRSSPRFNVTMKYINGNFEYYDFYKDTPDYVNLNENGKTIKLSDKEYKADYIELVNKVKENEGWKDMDYYKLTEYWTIILQYLEFGYTEDAYCFSIDAWNNTKHKYEGFMNVFIANLYSSNHIEYIKLKNPELNKFFIQVD